MKSKLIGFGVIVLIVGLVTKLVVAQSLSPAVITPLTLPVKLKSSGSVQTNVSIKAGSRYMVYLALDSKNLKSRDDNPRDMFVGPEKIPLKMNMMIQGDHSVIVQTNIVDAVLGSEGDGSSSYILTVFDMSEKGNLKIAVSWDRSEYPEIAEGNLEMRMNAAAYKDRLMVGTYAGGFAYIIMLGGLLLCGVGILLRTLAAAQKRSA